MLPYLAQGANSSLEDGAALGAILKSVTDKEQLGNALRVFQSIRKVRSESIAKETFKQVRVFDPKHCHSVVIVLASPR